LLIYVIFIRSLFNIRSFFNIQGAIVMQSQEGMSRPPQYSLPDEQKSNTDPREQQQPQETPPQQQNYEERSYEEGYVGLDADDMWQPRKDEKLRPRSTGQRSPSILFLLLALLCAIIIGASFIGVLITWLSWLLLTALVTGGVVIAILNWRTVTMPMPVQSFSVTQHPRLVITDTIGTVSIRRGENGVVNVAPTKRVSGIGVTPENMRMGYELQDNMLHISTQLKWNMFQFGLRSIDLEITVPEACDVQVNNGSGRITANGLHGNIQLKTGSGRIEVGDLRGNVALNTGSGSISGGAVSGQLALTTGSGRIELLRSAMEGTSRIKTGSGSITFDGTLDPRGNYELKTGSGSVQVTLAPDASFRLQASTGSGRVVNEFDGLTAPNGSQAPLKIKTGSGGIHVYRA
jgi:Putative adhesin